VSCAATAVAEAFNSLINLIDDMETLSSSSLLRRPPSDVSTLWDSKLASKLLNKSILVNTSVSRRLDDAEHERAEAMSCPKPPPSLSSLRLDNKRHSDDGTTIAAAAAVAALKATEVTSFVSRISCLFDSAADVATAMATAVALADDEFSEQLDEGEGDFEMTLDESDAADDDEDDDSDVVEHEGTKLIESTFDLFNRWFVDEANSHENVDKSEVAIISSSISSSSSHSWSPLAVDRCWPRCITGGNEPDTGATLSN
jgi:hypothetical protein